MTHGTILDTATCKEQKKCHHIAYLTTCNFYKRNCGNQHSYRVAIITIIINIYEFINITDITT